MHKYKFSKTRCRKCIYHRGMKGAEYCNYASVTGQTCLHRTAEGVADRRGDDYHNCLLFVKGSIEPAKKYPM